MVTDSHVIVGSSRFTYLIDINTHRLALTIPFSYPIALAEGVLYLTPLTFLDDQLVDQLVAIDTMTSPSEPALDIRINGVDVATAVNQGQPVRLTVSLAPHARSGQRADWWIWARSPSQTYWYTLDRGWVPSFTPIPAYEVH